MGGWRKESPHVLHVLRLWSSVLMLPSLVRDEADVDVSLWLSNPLDLSLSEEEEGGAERALRLLGRH